MGSDSSVVRLAEVCRQVGSCIPYWNQGQGGNVSLKVTVNNVESLYIKASGYRLGEVTAEKGLACLNLSKFRAALAQVLGEKAYADLLSDQTFRLAFHEAQPSMETIFHVLLPSPCVIHFHSVAALTMAHIAAKTPVRWSSWLAATAFDRVAIVSRMSPGLQLGLTLGAKADCQVLLLENHGVVLQGDDWSMVEKWKDFERKFCIEWGHPALVPAGKTYVGGTAPLRLYFPDTAVFLPRIKALLQAKFQGKQGEIQWQAHPSSEITDRNALEIWLATTLLYESCPDLPEIPRDLAAKIAGLPTEQFRKST
ncbi:MAG: class II aldolase/adducin family protein [Deltaproteobacteria bacterium]|nr:class II aldolase/adducin family protein [Deltaproteobacteria bacterium]